MDAEDEALAPSLDTLNPKARKKAPEAESESQMKAEERALAQLTTYPGWEIFERDYRAEVLSLRTMDGADLRGKSVEEVGKMFLIAREAATRMEGLLDRIVIIAEEVHKQQ